MDRMEKSDNSAVAVNSRRKILNLAVMNLVKEQGFQTAEKICLETLTEMLQCLMVELARSAARSAELAGRTVPMVGDVVISMINMGMSLQGIESFARRPDRSIIPLPQTMPAQKPINLLQAGSKASHPHHIPSYLPPLPDPHAYVRTPTYRQPVTEYEAIREKFANQKRDIEKALTKFLTRTSETNSLFETEDNMFPLIACKPSFPPYLEALNPTDQAFDFEELEYHYLVANRTEDVTSKDDPDNNESGDDEDGENGESKNERAAEKEIKQENQDIKPNSLTNKAILENPNIDNPYLRAAALPPKRLRFAQDVSDQLLMQPQKFVDLNNI